MCVCVCVRGAAKTFSISAKRMASIEFEKLSLWLRSLAFILYSHFQYVFR